MTAQSQNSDKLFCMVACWAVALLAGLMSGYMVMALADLSSAGGVFVGLIVFAILGVVLMNALCTGSMAAAPAPRANTAAAAPSGSTHTEASTSGAIAAAASTAAEATVAPSAKLAGEEELAARKGEWSYDKGEKSDTSSADKSAAKSKDYDGDGVLEGTDEGTKPETLEAARDGEPDDLKQIKGVGPKLEGLLHSLGFFHFDQVASWTAQEVAWVDANLEGFKGRVSRDNWVDQAKVLAAGGETEFSKKVEKGGVYE